MVLGPMTFGTTAATPVLTGPPGFLCLSGGRWNFLTNPNRRLPGSKNGGKNAQSNLLEAKNNERRQADANNNSLHSYEGQALNQKALQWKICGRANGRVVEKRC